MATLNDAWGNAWKNPSIWGVAWARSEATAEEEERPAGGYLTPEEKRKADHNAAMRGYAELPNINRPFGSTGKPKIKAPSVNEVVDNDDDDIIAILMLMD